MARARPRHRGPARRDRRRSSRCSRRGSSTATPSARSLALVPGLLAAAVAHSLYNHFFLSPLLAAGLLLVGLPLLVIAVFARSEQATREWLGVGLDSDLELVESIVSGQALETRIGGYLRSL